MNDLETTAAFDQGKMLTTGWLLLVLLTGASLGLGEWFQSASWLPLLVAGIVWLKGALVAHYFLEAHRTIPFIARMLKIFIAFTPIALLLTAFFGTRLVGWVTL